MEGSYNSSKTEDKAQEHQMQMRHLEDTVCAQRRSILYLKLYFQFSWPLVQDLTGLNPVQRSGATLSLRSDTTHISCLQ